MGSSPRMRGAPGEHIRDLVRQGIIPAYAGSTDAPREPRQLGEDHPRVCGEHSLRCDFRNPRLGSSPRMRGAHNERDDVELGVGIIPAYAGSTRRQLVFTYPHRDHPRVCGEHSFASNARRSTSGSSPRMRGAPVFLIPAGTATGIIPAYAGSTVFRNTIITSQRDHPRVCGEHAPASTRRLVARGSSPRMRGAHTTGADNSFSDGIIPAYAGSTPAEFCPRAGRWDHPRVCGEHPLLVSLLSMPLGSSPRMRGAQHCASCRCCHRGIIPAYAGSTSCPSPDQRSLPDHPRVCGEHTAINVYRGCPMGSSPRMRGAQYCFICQNYLGRIIPAYAGSTSSVTGRTSRSRDHPRVCGEHPAMPEEEADLPGSSPRMRGAHTGTYYEVASRGIIPAYAGSTLTTADRVVAHGDHPRVCGEHVSSFLMVPSPGGSSPRMRGALQGFLSHGFGGGIIPAYAGSTVARLSL